MRYLAALTLASTVAACGSGAPTVTGLVVDVQGDLEAITSFTLLREGGERMVFTPDPAAEFGFPLPHLRDHLISGEPVRVTYREEGGRLVATGVDDA